MSRVFSYAQLLLNLLTIEWIFLSIHRPYQVGESHRSARGGFFLTESEHATQRPLRLRGYWPYHGCAFFLLRGFAYDLCEEKKGGPKSPIFSF